jgi:hypothetical protein
MEVAPSSGGLDEAIRTTRELVANRLCSMEHIKEHSHAELFADGLPKGLNPQPQRAG